MDYKIIWSLFSENQIEEIYSYYESVANSKLAKKIVRKIVLAPDILIKKPKLGVLEPLLINKENEYRYILTSNYKIIYSIEEKDKSIRIANVFDTRQNPVKIEQSLK